MKNKVTDKNPRLDNWEVVIWQEDPFKAPEQCPIVLSGTVIGHPKLPDGSKISTSSVLFIDLDKNEAGTKSRKYSLGDPNPGFLDYIVSINRTLRDYHKPESD